MSETYSGDNTTDIISDVTMPNDGDVRNVASVRVFAEPFADSLASIASGHPIFTGTPEFNGASVSFTNSCIVGFHGSVLSMLSSSLLQVDYTSQLACHGAFELTPTVGHEAACQFNIREGSTWQVMADATAYVRADGILRIDAGGNLGVYGFARVQAGGLLSIEDDGVARIEDGGALNVLHGGTLTVSGALEVKQGPGGLGEVNVADAATVNFVDTARLTMSATAQILFTNTHIFGAKTYEGPSRYRGNDAYEDRRLKAGLVDGLTPVDQTVDAHHYDHIFFPADEWATASATCTITLADVPGDYNHPVTISGFAPSNAGVGSTVATVVDSQGDTIAFIQGNAWTTYGLALVYDRLSVPRWRTIYLAVQ